MTGSNQPASGRSRTAILASSCASGSQSDPPAPGELRERLGSRRSHRNGGKFARLSAGGDWIRTSITDRAAAKATGHVRPRRQDLIGIAPPATRAVGGWPGNKSLAQRCSNWPPFSTKAPGLLGASIHLRLCLRIDGPGVSFGAIWSSAASWMKAASGSDRVRCDTRLGHVADRLRLHHQRMRGGVRCTRARIEF